MQVMKAVRRHIAFVPLYLCFGAGCVGALAYGLRVALQSPDVQWRRRPSGEISNEEYRNKPYKLYSPSGDYEEATCPAPIY